MHCFLVGALRPGETFALRWEDIEPGRIRIDERVYRNELGDPKTETSNGFVAIPTSLELELALWKQQSERTGSKDFVFEARHHGKSMDGRSYLRRRLKPVANQLGIHGLTYQALRRTVATQIHSRKVGAAKDTQQHLRHANAETTIGEYVQEVPDSVRAAVEQWDRELQRLIRERKEGRQLKSSGAGGRVN